MANNFKKKFLATMGATIIALGIGEVTQADVLTFEDFSSSTDSAPIPSGYQGFNWNNFFYNDGSIPGLSRSGYDTGRASGNYVAYNGNGNTAFVGGGLFNFRSAFLTAAWNDGLSVTVDGLKNGVSLYSKTTIIDTTKPTFVNFDFLNIDTLRFTSFGGTLPGYLSRVGSGTQFALDNLTFDRKSQTVPEPTSVLTLAAIGTTAFILKRKKSVI
ncbi:MAG: PEP-CTERM sorting domain-containing protein [Scytonematopsis contorta HA4267-MV1]|jgi:hypothetical protein|nr:PEP-CTERM sorting domain-containing protein [Scytonematopsis contorta HA4267-MV1]